jgi:hypothetical protein
VSGLLSFLALTLRAQRRRILGLCAFGSVFLAAGATARIFTGDEHGHVELEQLFALGGTTLVSALLLLGWLVGRFPLIAALVLLAGVFSDDRHAGFARLYAVRPRSLTVLYGARVLLLALVAFVLSAVIMPVFDIIVLGARPAPGLFALITSQIVVFGALTALLSTVTRADAWVALFLGLAGIVWDALRRIDFLLAAPAPIRDAVSVVLPPQGALLRIEMAFGSLQPVPADALLYVFLYGCLLLLVAGIVLSRRSL